MAIQTAVKMDGGAPLSDTYVRIHHISMKKNRNSSDSAKHYVTYVVSVYVDASAANADKESTNALFVRELDMFQFTEVNPAGNLPGLAYADLKARIVGLGWESASSDIEDV